MSTLTLTQPALPLPKPADVYRLTVDQYDRMVEEGVLGEDDPVEPKLVDNASVCIAWDNHVR
jgi:hypothetical protein